MKKSFIVALAAAVVLSGCAVTQVDFTPSEVVTYAPKWHENYKDERLNSLVQTALANNADVKTAVLNLQNALLNAGVKKDDFLPTLSGEVGGSLNDDLSRSQSQKSFSSSLSLSYEIDIFAKVYDGYKASFWEAKSSEANLANLKLTITNSVVSTYFSLAYLNDIAKNLAANLENQKELLKITQAKIRYGRGEVLALNQAQENILNLQNQMLENSRSRANLMETLKNLVASPLDEKSLANASLTDIKIQSANLAKIKFENLTKRGDVAVAMASLNAAFYNHKATQKSLYPSITLAASFSDNDAKLNEAFGFNLFNGNLRINLPFLNYNKVQKNVKVAKNEFEKRKVNYENTLSQAANEVVKFTQLWEIDQQKFANLKKLASKEEEIVSIYKNKYNYGKSEFKDLISAQNSLLATQNSLLEAKQRLLEDEVGFFKAIGE